MKRDGFWKGLCLAAAGSLALYVARVATYQDFTFGYMIWNLLLAALPLAFVLLLVKRLATDSWLDKTNILLTLLWLGFLPNSFYLVTDLIHIAEVSSRTVLFDSVMLLSFALTGLLLGYTSVVLVHRELRSRLAARSSDRIVALIILACSFAIYLGRYMRWNTWDVIINPIGLVANVVDSLVVPQEGSPMLQTTLLFFGFLGVLYVVIVWLLPEALDVHHSTSGKRRLKKVK